MLRIRGLLLLLCISTWCQSFAQKDSVISNISTIPLKYLSQVSDKADKYSKRISNKTEKTLTKLSKWENKIRGLLQKADPTTAERLFGAGKLTFTAMLQKVKEGAAVAERYKGQYDAYRDKLTTGMKYLETKKDSLDAKYVKPLKATREKMETLDHDVAESEALDKMIKVRRKQLFDASVKYIGKSKYLTKINKEAYYYTETLRNYKEIFNDPKKTEETAVALLNKIPAFGKFMKENSALSSLFGRGGSGGTPAASLAGLQTRSSVNALIQQRVAQGGPNAAAAISANMQAAQAQLASLKNKILKAGGGNSSSDIPDFKPNNQKTKTFKQRLEFGSNFQITKSVGGKPAGADIGVSLGYKLNDNSTAGIGISYKMGYGSIQKLRITHEGIGLRSFIDWKIKKHFFATGGVEMSYSTPFKNIRSLQQVNAWQTSGLLGITKKLKVKTKFFKETKLQFLYDMFYRQHNPVTQPVIFRTGFNF